MKQIRDLCNLYCTSGLVNNKLLRYLKQRIALSALCLRQNNAVSCFLRDKMKSQLCLIDSGFFKSTFFVLLASLAHPIKYRYRTQGPFLNSYSTNNPDQSVYPLILRYGIKAFLENINDEL